MANEFGKEIDYLGLGFERFAKGKDGKDRVIVLKGKIFKRDPLRINNCIRVKESDFYLELSEVEDIIRQFEASQEYRSCQYNPYELEKLREQYNEMMRIKGEVFIRTGVLSIL